MLFVHYFYEYMRRCGLVIWFVSFTFLTSIKLARSTLILHSFNPSLAYGTLLLPFFEVNLPLLYPLVIII